MAVLSFAHLKNRKPAGDEGQTPQKPLEEKKEEAKTTAIPAPPSRTTYSIPAVMPSALLCATNYCQGCGRYLPATERDREALGIKYGQCLREVKTTRIENDIDVQETAEVWKNIPASATVSKCHFFLKQ